MGWKLYFLKKRKGTNHKLERKEINAMKLIT
jgi:hypothetical protein